MARWPCSATDDVRTASPWSRLQKPRCRLEHLDGQTWSLVDVGGAPGALVQLVPFVDGLEQWPPAAMDGQVATATSELLPTLAPGDAMSVWFSRYDAGQEAIVSRTAESNVRMGPVVPTVPPPR